MRKINQTALRVRESPDTPRFRKMTRERAFSYTYEIIIAGTLNLKEKEYTNFPYEVKKNK